MSISTSTVSPSRAEIILSRKQSRNFEVLGKNLSRAHHEVVGETKPSPSAHDLFQQEQKLAKIKLMDLEIQEHCDALKSGSTSTAQQKQYARARLSKLGPIYAALFI